MQEEWRDVVGFESTHQVSNKGRVMVKERLVKNNGTAIIKPAHIIKPYKTDVGYMQYNLHTNGKCVKKYAHRLVAMAFIPNPNGFNEVHHIDGCRTNNDISNLQWVLHKDHMRHRIVSQSAREHKKCCDCGIDISHKAKRCKICANKYQFPSWEKLCSWDKESMLRDIVELRGNFTALGNKYGLTDNAIRKRFKTAGLPCKSSYYK